MRNAFLLTLTLTLLPCFGQVPSDDPTWQTHGLCNGRAWQVATQGEKIYYTTGASEVLIVAARAEHPRYFPQSLNAAEFTKAVDRFYQEPENLPIPIVKTLQLVTMKANGDDPGVIDKAVATERRAAMTVPK
jgi:hypothetical protein